jgi:1,4-alpha-glucan branching enzyme
VRAPGAAAVELMGDFTNWQPVSLKSTGSEWWTIALPITTGIHELNVRMNGGPWTVPLGLMEKRDEFGSSVGVVVIR